MAISDKQKNRSIYKNAFIQCAASGAARFFCSSFPLKQHTQPARLLLPTMYVKTAFDLQFIRQRAAQFRDQLGRWQRGELTEDQFKPLRLQNG